MTNPALRQIRSLRYSFLTDDKQQRVRGPPSKIIRRGKLGAANHARNYFIELHNQEISTENWIVSIWMANGKQYGAPEPMFYFADDPKTFAEWFQNLLRDTSNHLLMEQVHIWIPPQPFDTVLNWKLVPLELLEPKIP